MPDSLPVLIVNFSDFQYSIRGPDRKDENFQWRSVGNSKWRFRQVRIVESHADVKIQENEKTSVVRFYFKKNWIEALGKEDWKKIACAIKRNWMGCLRKTWREEMSAGYFSTGFMKFWMWIRKFPDLDCFLKTCFWVPWKFSAGISEWIHLELSADAMWRITRSRWLVTK